MTIYTVFFTLSPNTVRAIHVAMEQLPAPAQRLYPADAGGGCLELPFPGPHQSGDSGSPGRSASGDT